VKEVEEVTEVKEVEEVCRGAAGVGIQDE